MLGLKLNRVSKRGHCSWSNSLITGIYPGFSARGHALVSPPSINDICEPVPGASSPVENRPSPESTTRLFEQQLVQAISKKLSKLYVNSRFAVWTAMKQFHSRCLDYLYSERRILVFLPFALVRTLKQVHQTQRKVHLWYILRQLPVDDGSQ